MRKYLTIIFIILLYKIDCFATQQAGDLLIFKNDTFTISHFPLDEFYDKGNSYNPGFFSSLSTACHRGYIAVWTIKEDKLYLQGILNCELNEKIPIDSIGRQPKETGLIFADWYSGKFKIDRRTREEYSGYWNISSLFTRKLTLIIDKGQVKYKE